MIFSCICVHQGPRRLSPSLLHAASSRLLSLGGEGASSTLSWNAVDFLNPHQSILGLRGRAYLKPPFPHELGLESVSEQLAG